MHGFVIRQGALFSLPRMDRVRRTFCSSQFGGGLLSLISRWFGRC